MHFIIYLAITARGNGVLGTFLTPKKQHGATIQTKMLLLKSMLACRGKKKVLEVTEFLQRCFLLLLKHMLPISLENIRIDRDGRCLRSD